MRYFARTGNPHADVFAVITGIKSRLCATWRIWRLVSVDGICLGAKACSRRETQTFPRI